MTSRIIAPCKAHFAASSFIAALVLFTGGAAQAVMAPSFMGLGDLPGDPFRSVAVAVSGDGRTVVGRGNDVPSAPIRSEAFRWTEQSGIVGLGQLPGGLYLSNASASTQDGRIIVGFSSSAASRASCQSCTEAFMWSDETGMVGLGDLDFGNFNSRAMDISSDGSVIVGAGTTGLGSRAFRWTAASGLINMGGLPGGGHASIATAVSANGSVIVGNAQSSASGFSNFEAFRWTQATGMVGLGFIGPWLSGFSSQAFDVTPDGSVVVGFSTAGFGIEAFRWTAETGMVGLGDLPGGGFGSLATAISVDGSTIVGWSDEGISPFSAMIWNEAQGIRSLKSVLIQDYNLDLTGWHLQSALDISADGRVIVGLGINPEGQTEAWMAVIPEPSSLSLLAFGALSLAARNRRYRCDPPVLRR